MTVQLHWEQVGNLGGYSGVYVLNFLKSGRLVFCLVLFFGNLLVPA